MSFGKKKILAAFLEKDNLKLLSYEGKQRVFAGQLSFPPEVLRDGFIADSLKFSSQVKIAFAQKESLKEVTEVVLFLPMDKTFAKTLPEGEGTESFVKGLPYFKEELVINQDGNSFVAFEKKLVEDFQRPFLESGKKVTAVKSGAAVLTAAYPQKGKYFLLVPLEKEILTIVAQDGVFLEGVAFKKEIFADRFKEFVATHNLSDVRQTFTLGVFPPGLAPNAIPLSGTDIYDLTFNAMAPRKKSIILFKYDTLNPRYFYLAGAVLAGALLVFAVVKGVGQINLNFLKSEPKNPPAARQELPPPKPEPRPADFNVIVLNGTLVTGEAGKLADKLRAAGYNILETKNATTAGFLATRLRILLASPTGGPAVSDKITADLKTLLLADYKSVSIEPLPAGRQDLATSSAQIEIIIGEKITK
ncbi:LytR C-terminal domain-containing protein [Candidatus Gottesmanbacteria bacterium]|nr:LytR C-terminal domain-containing protein [Candidatus Gottesmanbacteria bacterium]